MRLPMLYADKANHLAYGAALCAGVIVAGSVLGLAHSLSVAAGLLAASAAGALKELADMRGDGEPSWADLLATILGGALVAAPAALMLL